MYIDIVIFNRYNHAVTWATRHFISLISIRKKSESNIKEISKLHLLVVIYECTSGQRKHRTEMCMMRWGRGKIRLDLVRNVSGKRHPCTRWYCAKAR